MTRSYSRRWINKSKKIQMHSMMVVSVLKSGLNAKGGRIGFDGDFAQRRYYNQTS